ncbi:MAG: cobalt-precorrin-6A reductase [Candidatus Atelocyanobacterium thalassa]|uniref:Precorrin-6A reductase n=1 Tax=Candidatus Atelocyanobacterium thalassa isolate SIO64986 TaxID=1527444 RepID=A0A086CHT2_9CHRO|nr:MAG: precorrin-6A reductase [Candidatus Atelocyanobacterium thalassa isolate SIO64986]
MKNNGKLWLIGGTGDSAKIAKVIAENFFPYLVTVTTLQAIHLYKDDPNVSISIGKLSIKDIQNFCRKEKVKGIIDASHPFAENISRYAINIAQSYAIPYMRYERPSLPLDSQVIYLDSFKTLITKEYLAKKRVLLTVGCKVLPMFNPCHQQSLLFARILPRLSSLKIALAAGFREENIIGIRPPINLELEKAICKQWKIDMVVTKASGKQGGEDIKKRLSKELGISLIIIQRPNINYPKSTQQISDIIGFCYECLKQ